MEKLVSVKVIKECVQCGEFVSLDQFLERNSSFMESSVENHWNNSKKPILCDVCLNEKFQKKMDKLDRIFTPIAVSTISLCIFCLVFFPLFIWILDEVIKPIITSEVAWIITAVILIYYICAQRTYSKQF